LRNRLGYESIPSRQGEINPESRFILERFGLEEPILKSSYSGEDVYLIDFMERSQAPADIDEANIIGIVDHHKLGDLTTSAPLDMWVRAVGCSNTVVKQMFDIFNIDIPESLAGAMACAILSDTVIFKSPTSTKEDTKACRELAEIAGIEDVRALGFEMFRVKSDISGTPKRELVLRDFKDFNMAGSKVAIGQLEVVDLSLFDNMRDELFEVMEQIRVEGGRDTLILMLTDIIQEGTEILVVGDSLDRVREAFGIDLRDGREWLKGVMSRKKQIIPPLEKSFNDV